MALTPRSFLRSPALLVAFLISAGIALLGSALFISTFCCKADQSRTVVVQRTVDPLAPLRGGGCDHVLRENGSSLAAWQHNDWVTLAACFEGRQDNRRAATTAAQGLSYFPASERLHNIRGYNLIVLEEYTEAVVHLRVALQSVTPTSGVLENNLAWAGLFASDRMTLSEARRHYNNSIDRDGGSCEAYHTGMWVEYAVASRASGNARDAAIAQYNSLRAKYEPCTTRVDNGDRITGFEVAGAGILDGEIHKLTMVQMFERNQIHDGFAPHRTNLVSRSVNAMDINRADIDAACEDIAPVRSALPACRKQLRAAMCGR